MSIYTKITDFLTKDTLASGNPLKIVKGAEIDAELNAIAAADATNLKKDGSVTPTANIPMGGFTLTGLPVASATGQPVRYDEFNDHIVDAADAHDASAISNVPAGSIVATDVQSAINELDTEKAALAGANFTGPINEARGTIAMHATTMDIWAQPNIIDGTGSVVTITAIANAPQPGARRTIYPIAGTVITNGATFAVDGAANYTTQVGDALEFEAVTTSTYKVHIIKKDGTAVVGGLTLGTAVATTSGTAIDFTGIPSWVNRISINFDGVSTGGTNPLFIQIGDSGGIETTGYASSAATVVDAGATSAALATTGFLITGVSATTYTYAGTATLTRMGTDKWALSSVLGNSGSARTSIGGGTKTLSATLDRVRLTTTTGVDTFDAGSVNITWE